MPFPRNRASCRRCRITLYRHHYILFDSSSNASDHSSNGRRRNGSALGNFEDMLLFWIRKIQTDPLPRRVIVTAGRVSVLSYFGTCLAGIIEKSRRSSEPPMFCWFLSPFWRRIRRASFCPSKKSSYLDFPVGGLATGSSGLCWVAIGYWFNVYEKLDSAHPRVVLRDTFRQCAAGRRCAGSWRIPAAAGPQPLFRRGCSPSTRGYCSACSGSTRRA